MPPQSDDETADAENSIVSPGFHGFSQASWRQAIEEQRLNH
jgi:hypothetical protein